MEKQDIKKQILLRENEIFRLKSELEKITNLEKLEKQKKEYELYETMYTDEMIDSLIQEMEFEFIWYGDMVSVWVEWKRPFWNSNIEWDIINILWLSTEKYTYEFWSYEYSYVMKRIAKRINTRLNLI